MSSFQNNFTNEVNERSKIVHIKSDQSLKMEGILHKQENENKIWPKRNVPRSVVENYEPKFTGVSENGFQGKKINTKFEAHKNSISSSKYDKRSVQEDNVFSSQPDLNRLKVTSTEKL